MAHHHDALFNALCDEIDDLNPEGDLKRKLKNDREAWRLSIPQDAVFQRARLRSLVNLLRNCRRAAEAHVEAALALPWRLFSSIPGYRKAFAGPPGDAAAMVARLLASTKSDLDVVAKLQKMRARNSPGLGAPFTIRGWHRVEMHLARRAGELSADLMAYTWAAGEMPWSVFLENARAVRTEVLDKFGPARGEPRVDEVLDLVEQANLEEGESDDGDHGR